MKQIVTFFFVFVTSFFFAFAFSGQAVSAVALQRSAFSAPTAGVTTVLTVTKVGKGVVTITPKQATYPYGQIVTLTAQPDLGWTFVGWDGDLASSTSWWNTNWAYRTAIKAEARAYERTDKPAEIEVNFTNLLAPLGENQPFDEASLRLIEVSSDSIVLDDNVPFQFDKATTYNAATNAKGTLVFIMQGTTPANSSRLYHLYFDVAGKSFTPPVVTQQVTLLTGQQDEGAPSVKIQTAIGAYSYHTEGGGFSSLDDVNGADWLSYNQTAGAAGTFRGIPNMIHPAGRFHPGGTGVDTTIVQQGPLKVTMRSTTVVDGNTWEALWEIFPRYARMTLLQAGANYWFLYEGTPGGVLDANDFVVLSDGSQLGYAGSWNSELVNEEWAYFSDPNAGANGRSLFVAKHEDDTQPDSYRKMGNTDSMTVWGFGRQISSDLKFLSGTPAHFTVGLVDETAFNPTAKSIYAAYKALDIAIAPAERRPQTAALAINPSPTITVTMVMNRNIVATFTRQQLFDLTIKLLDENGAPLTQGGAVTASPPTLARGYLAGETATLTATAAPGWTFLGWGGSLAGANPVAQLTFDGNEVVTASFARQYYQLDLQIINGQGGSATASPPTSAKGYVYGETATLTATPVAGWAFQDWSGSLSGSGSPKTLTFDGNEAVVATFAQEHYTLTIHVVDPTGHPITQGAVKATPPTHSLGYLYGETTTLTATASPGWTFQGWSGSLSGANPKQNLIFDGNEVVTATFAPLHYALEILVVDEHGAPVTGGMVQTTNPANPLGYIEGETATLTATVSPGWTFQGWSGDLTGTAPTQLLTFDDNKQVVAIFTQNHYTIQTNTLNDQGEPAATGVISFSQPAAPAGYVYGEVVTVTATPNAGWAFINWSGSLVGFSNPITLMVDGNEIINAFFGQVQYTLSLQTNDPAGGTVLANPLDPYVHGQVVTITASPNPGWRFDGWSGDLTGAVNPTTLLIDANKAVTAAFTPIQYHLTIDIVGGQDDPGGAVIVTPLKAFYSYNEEVTLTAVPAVGYQFSGWIIAEATRALSIAQGEGPTEPVIKVKIMSDVTYRAQFEPLFPNRLFLPMIMKAQ